MGCSIGKGTKKMKEYKPEARCEPRQLGGDPPPLPEPTSEQLEELRRVMVHMLMVGGGEEGPHAITSES